MTAALTVLNLLASPLEWCAAYRQLGLPADVRGEFVELHTGDEITALLLPAVLASPVIKQFGSCVPTLWRPSEGTGRQWLLAHPAGRPVEPNVIAELEQAKGCVCPSGTRIPLPTTTKRRHDEGFWWLEWPEMWFVPPLLPLLQATLATRHRQLED